MSNGGQVVTLYTQKSLAKAVVALMGASARPSTGDRARHFAAPSAAAKPEQQFIFELKHFRELKVTLASVRKWTRVQEQQATPKETRRRARCAEQEQEQATSVRGGYWRLRVLYAVYDGVGGVRSGVGVIELIRSCRVPVLCAAEFEQHKRSRDGVSPEKDDIEKGGDNFLRMLHSRLALNSTRDAIFWTEMRCGEGLRMPDVSYNPTLNPLEVRVKCSRAASQSESWQVVIASSLQPGMTPSEKVARYFFQQEEQVDSDKSTPLGADVHFASERPPHIATDSEDREPESYSWINRPSESSSLCLDDLTDIDILSQISAYYG